MISGMTWAVIGLVWLALSCAAVVVAAALGRAGALEDARRAMAERRATALPAPRQEQPLPEREPLRS